jgi:hypothetical protein
MAGNLSVGRDGRMTNMCSNDGGVPEGTLGG